MIDGLTKKWVKRIQHSEKLRLRWTDERTFQFRYYSPTLKGLEAIKRQLQTLVDNPKHMGYFPAIYMMRCKGVYSRFSPSIAGPNFVQSIIDTWKLLQKKKT